MKKALFIYERRLSELPPLLTLIQLLKTKGYSVTVTVSELENQYQDQNITMIEYNRKFKSTNRITRYLNRRFIGRRFFKIFIPKLIKEENFDFVWLIISHSPYQLLYLDHNSYKSIKYYCTLYELFDTLPLILNKIKPLVQNAEKVIVPEFNRAHIIRTYLNLPKTPFILPNKPLSLPNLTDRHVMEKLAYFKNKKIILYQGHITRTRNMEAICEAVERCDGYCFVLMGRNIDGYVEELLEKYKCVKHIDFIMPPKHLEFTSKAYIGIVAYNHVALNGVFCAPNKIWEYSGYGIPMICNDMPGLVYTVEQNNCGVCIDFNNVESVFKAITKIENDYLLYSNNARNMYDSVNLSSIVDNILG